MATQIYKSQYTGAQIDEAVKRVLNGEAGGGVVVETDPTVPSWAKQPSKPKYTASEVGAAPAQHSHKDYVKTVNGKSPDENGNVTVSGGGGGSGEPGEDGFSPIATVEQTGSGAVISITDKNGTTTATVTNGKDGNPGADGYTPVKGKDYFDGNDGQPGKDGVSATHSWNGTVLTVTSASGTSSADLKGEKGDKGDKGDSIKGDKGDTGAQGEPGKDGTNGKDGTSVTVKSVSESTADGGSNVVTFSDGKTLTVKNGSKGSTGATGAAGKNGADGKTPVKGVDYFTEADKAEMVADVMEAIAEADEIKIFERSGGYFTIADLWQEAEGYNTKYTDYISVNSGDKFSYKGLGLWYAASVIWYDTSKNLLSYEQYGESHEEMQTVVVTAPAGSAYVRFFSMASDNVAPVLEVSRYEELTPISTLTGKKIVYDGDSICYGAGYVGGYAKLIAEKVGGTYENQAVGGARLTTKGSNNWHSVVDNLPNLPKDADLYCFNGGVNDYWTPATLGTFDYSNFDGALDTSTVCGALETIFRYCLNNFVGKPVCFVITHKVQQMAYKDNANGDSFKDYHDAMVGICEKYSIPYYDAFSRSGLNGWNTVQNQVYFTDGDGCHPNEEAYKRYYVPQLVSLFESMMPEDVTEPEVPTEPTYTNVLESAGYTKGIYLSNGNESTDANAYTTGYITCPSGSTVYLKNVRMPNESSHGNRIGLYKADKSVIGGWPITSSQTSMNPVFDSDGSLIQFDVAATDLAYIRISAWKIDETSIITVNEPIV